VKLPNFRFFERPKDDKAIFFLNLVAVFSEFNSRKKFANIWQIIDQDGIRAQKFEAARIHFPCDVAVVNAKAASPNQTTNRD